MRLATIRLDGRHSAVRIDGDEAIEVGVADVGELPTHPTLFAKFAGWLTGRCPGSRLRTPDTLPELPRWL